MWCFCLCWEESGENLYVGGVAREGGVLPRRGVSGRPDSGPDFQDLPSKDQNPRWSRDSQERLGWMFPIWSPSSPLSRPESNNGYMERECSFCLHFISSQEIIFSSVRPAWAEETPTQSFPLSPHFQNLSVWFEWAFDEYQKDNILTHSFCLRGRIF